MHILPLSLGRLTAINSLNILSGQTWTSWSISSYFTHVLYHFRNLLRSSHVFSSLCSGSVNLPPLSSRFGTMSVFSVFPPNPPDATTRQRQLFLFVQMMKKKLNVPWINHHFVEVALFWWHRFDAHFFKLSLWFIHILWAFIRLLITALCELKLNLEC